MSPRRINSEALEILDEKGVTLGSVTLPTDPRLFGADKGTVYLKRPVPTMDAPGGRTCAA